MAVAVAVSWRPKPITGAEARGRHLEGAGDLHHRERLLLVDIPAADGRVYDTDRVMYLRNYLVAAPGAAADGVP